MEQSEAFCNARIVGDEFPPQAPGYEHAALNLWLVFFRHAAQPRVDMHGFIHRALALITALHANKAIRGCADERVVRMCHEVARHYDEAGFEFEGILSERFNVRTPAQ